MIRKAAEKLPDELFVEPGAIDTDAEPEEEEEGGVLDQFIQDLWDQWDFNPDEGDWLAERQEKRMFGELLNDWMDGWDTDFETASAAIIDIAKNFTERIGGYRLDDIKPFFKKMVSESKKFRRAQQTTVENNDQYRADVATAALNTFKAFKNTIPSSESAKGKDRRYNAWFENPLIANKRAGYNKVPQKNFLNLMRNHSADDTEKLLRFVSNRVAIPSEERPKRRPPTWLK